jgi:malate dehydrogenase (oxaloacetate-decarboxylating)(NADP+)
MGLGCVISGAIRVHDDMFLAAAESLASEIRPEHLARRQLFPAFSEIRSISAHIGAAVAAKAYELGLATRLPQPKDLLAYAKSSMYTPTYRRYR